MAQRALIAGVSGIVGNNLASHLVSKRLGGLWPRPQADRPASRECVRSPPTCSTPTRCGLPFPGSTRPTSSSRPGSARPPRPRIASRERRHGAEPPVRRRLGQSLRHVALVTGLKHYLGPFEAYARTKPVTPFREEMPRLPLRELLLHAGGRGLRGRRAARLRLERAPPPHDHRLRPGQRHEHGRHPRRLRHDLPGDRQAVRLPRLAPAVGRADRRDRRPSPGPKHLEWAATSEAARDQAFNIVNGDIFRWNWLWPKLAADFGIEAAPYPGRTRRSNRNWRTRGRSGRGSRRSMALPSRTSPSSRRPGTPTWTSGARWRS